MSDGPLETARAFFTDFDAKRLGGVLAAWRELQAGGPAFERFDYARRLDRVELVEAKGDHAVVDVRGEKATIRRGTARWKFDFDGPAILERTGEGWRVVDYTLDGRMRSHALVLGPLAEQERDGVVVRVLGVDRRVRSTSLIVDVENGSGDELRVERTMIRIFASWSPARFLARTIPAGGKGKVVTAVGEPVSLSQDAITLGLRLLDGARKLDFLLQVPLARPDEVVRQPPPKRLPRLPHSRRAGLLVLAAATAAFALFIGWSALTVPLVIGLTVWRSVRAAGRVPGRLYPVRHLLDALVIAAAPVILWFTPAADLAVPFAVGLLAWGGARLLGLREGRRFGVALGAFVVWLLFLGGPRDALSPCRIADGTPAHAADVFVHRRYGGRRVRRRDFAGSPFCLAVGPGSNSYLYSGGAGGSFAPLVVGVDCDVRHWRARTAL